MIETENKRPEANSLLLVFKDQDFVDLNSSVPGVR